MKKAFSMIELIFVIVIIGILSAIALPKFSEPLNQTRIFKASEEVVTIRNGIVNALNDNLMEGNNICPSLENNIIDDNMFDGILQHPIAKNAWGISWNTTNGISYTLSINDEKTTFTYNNNISTGCLFTCNNSDDLCQKINKILDKKK